jgi:hypothetical protein
MSYNHFRYARRVDADQLGIYHGASKMLNIDKGTANHIVIEGLTAASKILRLKGCEGSVYSYIDVEGGGNIELITGGLVLFGVTSDHIFDMTGVHFMHETTTPSARADYGAIYTKNDNNLYFQDGAGVEHTVQFA